MSLSIVKAQTANRILRSMNTEGKLLEPLQKEFPSGDDSDGGVQLANALCPDGVESWQSWPPIARPMICELPPRDLFPASKDEINDLDDIRILRLIAFYNDGFGIQRDDTIERRREKFRRWCLL